VQLRCFHIPSKVCILDQQTLCAEPRIKIRGEYIFSADFQVPELSQSIGGTSPQARQWNKPRNVLTTEVPNAQFFPWWGIDCGLSITEFPLVQSALTETTVCFSGVPVHCPVRMVRCRVDWYKASITPSSTYLSR
jgi:hypothetical protein